MTIPLRASGCRRATPAIEAAAGEEVVAAAEPCAFWANPSSSRQTPWRRIHPARRFSENCASSCSASTSIRRSAASCSPIGRSCRAQVDSDEILQHEDEILNIFVDICSLCSRDSPGSTTAPVAKGPARRPILFSYLRMVETQGRKGFLTRLYTALDAPWPTTAFTTFDRSPELKQSLLWICKSHQRMDQQMGVGPGDSRAASGTRGYASLRRRARPSGTLLERMIAITRDSFRQSATWRAKCVTATSIIHCSSERGEQVYDQADDHLAYLRGESCALRTARTRVRALVECPAAVGLLCFRATSRRQTPACDG